MTMTFLPPLAAFVSFGLFLAGLGLAAVPIIIHLFNRRRVRHVRWAAMNWLMAAMKRHQRRLRLENWLILALRVAAVILLGLALARPVLTDSALSGLVAGKRSIFLVVDNSFSTDAKLDARSVFEAVRHEADLVLEGVGPDDSTTVIVTNDPDEDATNGLSPHVLLGRTVGREGAARAREQIAALRTRHAPADWNAALEQIQDLMNDEDVNRHVLLVTDLQAKDWLRPPREAIPQPGASAAVELADADRIKMRLIEILRRPARVRVVNVGGNDRRDLAVTAIENRTQQDPFVGRPLRLAVTVANHGAAPVTGAQIEVMVDGQDRKRTFRVPPIAAATTTLQVPRPAEETVQVDLPKATFQEPGSHTLRIAVTPPREDPGADSLALSSERWLALRVRRRIHVVAWAHTSDGEKFTHAEEYLRGVYEGLSPADGGGSMADDLPPIYAYQSATSEAALISLLRGRSRSPVDLVVLANVVPRDERLAQELREFVKDGGGLLVFTGDGLRDAAALNGMFHTDGLARRLLPFPLHNPEVRRRSSEDAGRPQPPYRLDLEYQVNPHPLAAPFTNVEAEDWIKQAPPAIWGRTPFGEPTAEPVRPEAGDSGEETAPTGEREASVVLRFEKDPGSDAPGAPAVVSSVYGAGRTVWVGTSVDNGWLATSVLFLPVFLDEAALFLTRPADTGRNLQVGGVLRSTVPAEAERVRFHVPGGGQVSPTRLSAEDGEPGQRALYRYGHVGLAGIWSLTYEMATLTGDTRTVQEAFAVNPDPAEGSLTPAAERALRDGIPEGLDFALMRSYGDMSTELEEAREGELTELVLWVLLGILVLESILALRFGRRRGLSQTPETP